MLPSIQNSVKICDNDYIKWIYYRCCFEYMLNFRINWYWSDVMSLSTKPQNLAQ